MCDLQEATGGRVLAMSEPHPLEVFNEAARSQYLIVCEHAGKRIPRSLGTMGLSEEDRCRHIAWDIGAKAVAVALSEILAAPLFTQRYSRLVCDCNRQPGVSAFTPDISEATAIPGNRNLSEEDKQARADEIFWPFHDAITVALDARQEKGLPTKLITVHTFTPVYLGRSRPWEIGVLFNRDRGFAPAIARWLQDSTELCVGVNEPYAVGDETDYAIPVHGERRGIPCVEFEIRNDLITGRAEARSWANLIARSVSAVPT